jgi:hypothetical protein
MSTVTPNVIRKLPSNETEHGMKNKRMKKALLTFIVEFASTPIKHQPKTSTPVKKSQLV